MFVQSVIPSFIAVNIFNISSFLMCVLLQMLVTVLSDFYILQINTLICLYLNLLCVKGDFRGVSSHQAVPSPGVWEVQVQDCCVFLQGV